ncbi:hypothetical protein Pla110_24750 [Polystyrenella longa]|uniref:Uncharacterized protein n=1 Tax=Polystyrenella longa TaxID=2528007 RepID=A0A518CND8_9PLAN|nr:hypothetical protein [Polystyrenella longa]QDU80742.1 hypothetical protein Pla110_24750 [Polystyrenella longa]
MSDFESKRPSADEANKLSDRLFNTDEVGLSIVEKWLSGVDGTGEQPGWSPKTCDELWEGEVGQRPIDSIIEAAHAVEAVDVATEDGEQELSTRIKAFYAAVLKHAPKEISHSVNPRLNKTRRGSIAVDKSDPAKPIKLLRAEREAVRQVTHFVIAVTAPPNAQWDRVGRNRALEVLVEQLCRLSDEERMTVLTRMSEADLRAAVKIIRDRSYHAVVFGSPNAIFSNEAINAYLNGLKSQKLTDDQKKEIVGVFKYLHRCYGIDLWSEKIDTFTDFRHADKDDVILPERLRRQGLSEKKSVLADVSIKELLNAVAKRAEEVAEYIDEIEDVAARSRLIRAAKVFGLKEDQIKKEEINRWLLDHRGNEFDDSQKVILADAVKTIKKYLKVKLICKDNKEEVACSLQAFRTNPSTTSGLSFRVYRSSGGQFKSSNRLPELRFE